ncbi:MAG: hypothetical protein Q7R58_01810 [bacterium]|nr:hypothetical protein [bacterium]
MRNMFVGTGDLLDLFCAAPTLDTVVRIPCIARPAYPSGIVERVMHPDLQNTGPAEYNLRTDVRQWSYDGPKDSVVTGRSVYDYLDTRDEISNCLGLLDSVEINGKGAPVFSEVFGDNVIFFLRSTIQHSNGNLCAPFLSKRGNEMKTGWYWLGGLWLKNYRVLRFN